jgi:hypothetical protein
MSSDYRLSPLGSILAGLTVARVIDQHLTLSLGFTWQSQSGRDRVIPTGTPPPPEEGGGNLIIKPVSAADMSILTIVGGLSWHP